MLAKAQAIYSWSCVLFCQHFNIYIYLPVSMSMLENFTGGKMYIYYLVVMLQIFHYKLVFQLH